MINTVGAKDHIASISLYRCVHELCTYMNESSQDVGLVCTMPFLLSTGCPINRFVKIKDNYDWLRYVYIEMR